MEIRCIHPDCKMILAAPFKNIMRFNALMRELGWKRRGSLDGSVYYCHKHPPAK
jgi:hypothetical protein